MRRRVLLAGVMFLMISASAALASDTKTDYDRSTNFSRYHTFAWRLDKDTDRVVENSIILSRIQDAATIQLNARGLSESDINPDVYLVPHVSARNVQNLEYFPGPGWGWGWGWSNDAVVFNYVEGTIILDMVDARTDQLVWRSISTKTGNDLISVQKEKKVNKMMDEAFEHFPRWPSLER